MEHLLHRSTFSNYGQLKQKLQICLLRDEISDLQEMVGMETDTAFITSALEEIEKLETRLHTLENKFKHFDPEDQKNAVIEIQAGVGGDESALFAADLYRMYELYCKELNYKIELLDFADGNAGGFKFISFIIESDGAYGTFKYESGVHRVQRVPKTETKGRVHTSTAAVVVMPEQTIEQIDINKNDVRTENFCAGGPGGQHQNKTQNAVRLTHLPTGVSVVSRSKSLQANLKFCWKMLATKINEMIYEKASSKAASTKKQLRGQAARSEKIRTYNYPDNRVTDHRVEGGKYSLQSIINGDLEKLFIDVKDQLEAE